MVRMRSRMVARSIGRWAWRMLFPVSGIGWHVPPPGAFPSAGDGDGVDEELVIDPRALDAWLREVLGENGGGVRGPDSGRKRRRPPVPPPV
jgi:hypothetical protein